MSTPFDVLNNGMNQGLNMVMQSVRNINSLNNSLMNNLAKGLPNPQSFLDSGQSFMSNFLSLPNMGNVGQIQPLKIDMTKLQLPKFEPFSQLSGVLGGDSSDEAELFGTTESENRKSVPAMSTLEDSSDDAALF